MLQAAADHYRASQRLTVATLAAVRREWMSIGDDFDAGWSRVGPRIVALVTAGQVGAARNSTTYVATALAEQGIAAGAELEVVPQRFAGLASSVDRLTYGSLDSMLFGAVVHARSGAAESIGDRLAVGRSFLDLAVHSQLADASTFATSAGVAVRPRVRYVRLVNPPCCKRCAVLAGKPSGEVAFSRHPGCDCKAVPCGDDTDGLVADVGPEHIKDLTRAERMAISDGADMNQVINASRQGAKSADGLWTSEGATKGSYASRVRLEVARLKGAALKTHSVNVGQRGAVKSYTVRRLGPRPTPEAIYRYGGSREEIVRILHAQGYVTGDLSKVAAIGAGRP